MKYLHISKLEEYHPGYKDRKLVWCKTYFKMLHVSPDFEMLCEIDKWRFVAFVMLELQLRKPVPLNEAWLARKGFDLKKRSLAMTLKTLENLIILSNSEDMTQETEINNVTEMKTAVSKKFKTCNVDKDKDKDKEEEEDMCNVTKPVTHKGQDVCSIIYDFYIKTFNRDASKYRLSDSRKSKILQRFKEFKSVDLLKQAILNRSKSAFHLGENPQNKKYIDLVDHIFRNFEYTEKLIFDPTLSSEREREEWKEVLYGKNNK